MTRTDEQLLFQTIDQIQRPLTTTLESKTKNYEERLRASLNKLILPDWYNHEYTSINGLRKTKSQGHVPRLKRINENSNNNNNNNNPNSHDESPRLSHSSQRPSYRHRSPSRSWSERPPVRRDSTSSSYDSTGHVLTTRRSYAPGVQRVAQSSTWYKPRLFPVQLPERPPVPKPRPRQQQQQMKIDEERLLSPPPPPKSVMAEIPPEEVTLPRTNSNRSLTSEAESYRSAKNLPGTDSSSYASVNDRCLSPSTASYHTALGGESSTGYETPTPQLDDEDGTLSSQSSLSDLSRAETLEPTIEDLECVQSTLVSEFPSVSMNPSATTAVPAEAQHLSPTSVRPMENSQTHWYEGSLETCIPQTQTSNVELREISNDEDLREIDLNTVGDEFFLFSPRDDGQAEDEPSEPVSLSPSRTSNRIFTMDNQQLNFHYSSSTDPFGADGTTLNNPPESAMMITNLDDIFMTEDDDQELLQATEEHLQRHYRRPIQEDILYEVEHENSFSEQSQNTSSIVPIDHQQNEGEEQTTSSDYLTSAKTETVPIYVLSPSLQIDVQDDPHHQIPSELTSPSYYTSKIRHRHYSVGSYYDHKSTSVALPNHHPLYLLGSAPVSPLNRLSTTSDSFYSYSPIVSNPLHRMIQPLMDADEHHQASPQDVTLKATIRKSAATFPHYSIPTPPAVPPRMKSINADLQFIRGAIERVFDFNEHQPSTEPIYEEIGNQYPAVEAIQRFYKPSVEPVTNLDDLPASHSSVSNQFYGTRIKSSEQEERASSEEIDDTLNDIEDVDESAQLKQTSQETQTFEQQKAAMVNEPIEIVTEVMIEQANPNAQIEEINGDMIIFYDDIEIVEHSSRSYSSECDSASSSSVSEEEEEGSDHYSKPRPLAPPIPARTLKPSHLVNHSAGNPTYEVEKSFPKKKFDINSVNDMLNRSEMPLNASNPHRLPSARHFVGKLNAEELTISNGHQRVPAQRSAIADTSALVKQIQSSLSRTSLHEKQSSANLSTSSKDLRTFVSNTYSPATDEPEDSTFKRQARLSKSYHNVSEYPSKSVENHLDQVIRAQPIAMKLPSVVAATSSIEENPRMMSMKWYTGQVNENSEISYEKTHLHMDDLLHGYVFTHGNSELQTLLTRLERSNDMRIQTALDDIRLRVAEFDASKTQDDLPGFLKYLERRLRGINTSQSVPTSKATSKQQINEDVPSFDTISNKSRTSSVATSSSNRQYGRQQFRPTGTSNGYQRPIPPRRTSSNQENPVNADDVYNTVLGLPKKSNGSTLSRERPAPLIQTQMTTNTSSLHKSNRDIGKRLFESGTLKDPRLIYDGPKKVEKEEEPLETSV